MIVISKNGAADTRTCDYANVSKYELFRASQQHIADVQAALGFFRSMLDAAAAAHDPDKLSDIDGFHADFIGGFASTKWLERHYKLNRHHLAAPGGVPADVNLIDVLDMVADCVMAGMARSGIVRPVVIPDEVLRAAVANTVSKLAANVVVVPTKATESAK